MHWVIYTCLGVATVGAVLNLFVGIARFSADSERIASALLKNREQEQALAQSRASSMATNLTDSGCAKNPENCPDKTVEPTAAPGHTKPKPPSPI